VYNAVTFLNDMGHHLLLTVNVLCNFNKFQGRRNLFGSFLLEPQSQAYIDLPT
jgi:hypothetical protein